MTSLSSTASFQMGKSYCAGNFTGWLDEIRHYSVALSPAEVSAVWSPELSRSTGVTAQATGCLVFVALVVECAHAVVEGKLG